jgi:Zn-dependent protease with chaperone function
MKRLCLILVFAVGCAGPKLPVIQSPVHMNKIMPIVQKVETCMEIQGVGSLPVYIVDSTDPNAMCDGEAIYFTTALLDNGIHEDFIILLAAHELAHYKLGHLKHLKIVSYSTTGVFLVLNAIIPGAGYLNYLVNPAITNNVGKFKELEADRVAAESCAKCGILSVQESIASFEKYYYMLNGGGGFFSTHPSAQDRIENLKKLPN